MALHKPQNQRESQKVKSLDFKGRPRRRAVASTTVTRNNDSAAQFMIVFGFPNIHAIFLPLYAQEMVGIGFERMSA